MRKLILPLILASALLAACGGGPCPQCGTYISVENPEQVFILTDSTWSLSYPADKQRETDTGTYEWRTEEIIRITKGTGKQFRDVRFLDGGYDEVAFEIYGIFERE